MTDVKIIRLLGSTDDIISKVEKNKGKFRLKDPVIVRIVPQEIPPEQQQPNGPKIVLTVALAPFIPPYAKQDTIECDKCQVVLMFEPTDEIVERYNSIFNLVQPVKSHIIVP